MTTRHVRRRDFTNHWAFTPSARRLLKLGHRVLEWRPLPAPVFLALLALLAFAGSRGRLIPASILALLMAVDYALLAWLPRSGRSYGPPQPATLVLAVPRVLFALLPLPTPVALSIQLLGSALAFYGAWIEPHRLGIGRQRLLSTKLSPGRPIRLLHFGDLHIERVTARERQLVESIASLAPDLVAFSGDFLNTTYSRDRQAWAACRWVFERVKAPLGVYVVAGSSAADPEDVLPSLLDGLPLRWLRSERVTLEHRGQSLDLIGVGCTHRPFDDRVPVEALRAPERFTILLYHTPDLAPDAAELGIDLMLSGHTHGGQVRVPVFGALATSSLYGKAFEMGRYEIGAMTLYVTRGVGLEGSGMPRIRFLCPPEIVLWEIDGEPAPRGPSGPRS